MKHREINFRLSIPRLKWAASPNGAKDATGKYTACEHEMREGGRRG